MKILFRQVLLILLCGLVRADAITVVLPDRPTATELAFADTLTNALATTNVAMLALLAHCEADEAWEAEWFFQHLVQHSCDEIRIERADSAGAAQYAKMLTGSRADLPVRWLVVLRQPPLLYEAADTNISVLPAALFDGKIVITQRMAVFSPFQKQLLVGVAALSVLLAVWYAARFILSCWRDVRPIRYAPAGLSILLLCFAGECRAVVFAMPWFMPHPLRLLILPIVGFLVCFAAVFYDERAKAGATATGGPPPNTPAAALVNTWKLWRTQQGPFASPRVRFAVLSVVTLVAVWLGAYIWSGTSLSLHPAHVQGTVTRDRVARGGIRYTYTVDGHQYFGGGVGSFNRIYPVGSPVDVKYSSTNPAFSTIDDDPFLFLKQLAFGLVVMGGFILVGSQKRKS